MASALKDAVRAGPSGLATELLYDTIAEACEDFMMQLYGKCHDAAYASGTPIVQCLQRALRTLNDWTGTEMREASAELLAREPMSARLLKAAGRRSLGELRDAGLATNAAFATQLGPFLHIVFQRVAIDPSVLTAQYFSDSPEAVIARWLLHRQVIRSALALGCGATAPAPGAARRARAARRPRAAPRGNRRQRPGRGAQPRLHPEPRPRPQPEPQPQPELQPELQPQQRHQTEQQTRQRHQSESQPQSPGSRARPPAESVALSEYSATSTPRQSLLDSFLADGGAPSDAEGGAPSDAGSIVPEDSVSRLGSA